jgi:hypothetical protein
MKAIMIVIAAMALLSGAAHAQDAIAQADSEAWTAAYDTPSYAGGYSGSYGSGGYVPGGSYYAAGYYQGSSGYVYASYNSPGYNYNSPYYAYYRGYYSYVPSYGYSPYSYYPYGYGYYSTYYSSYPSYSYGCYYCGPGAQASGSGRTYASTGTSGFTAYRGSGVSASANANVATGGVPSAGSGPKASWY